MEPAHAVSIAMCQMLVVGGDLSGNTARAVAMIQQAAEQGADIAVLPECCDLGWTDPSSQNQATAVPDGAFCQAMMAAAQANCIHICCGLTEQWDQIFNAAVLLMTMAAFCYNIPNNELDIDHAYYDHGTACMRLRPNSAPWHPYLCRYYRPSAHSGQIVSLHGATNSVAVLGPSMQTMTILIPWRYCGMPAAQSRDFSLPIVGA